MTAIDLTELAELDHAYRNAEAEAKRWKKAADTLKARIQTAMGDSTEASINGLPAYTWKPSGQFQATRFTAENPELAAKYTTTVEVLDTEALKAEQPGLFTAYRSRVFKRA
jgi:hypothetical protein